MIPGSSYPYIPENVTLDSSLMFNTGGNLTRSLSASNRKLWTWASWVRRGILDSNQTMFAGYSNGTNYTEVLFNSSNQLNVLINTGGTIEQIITNARYRDVTNWYHIVVAMDTTQGTASNRIKLYVNNEEVTSFATATYPILNRDTQINNNVSHNIGARTTSTNEFKGLLADTYFIDGQALTPSSFVLSTSLEQLIPTNAILSYGSNGFRLKYTNEFNLGIDASSNGNTFSVNGTLSNNKFLESPTKRYMSGNVLNIKNGMTFSDAGHKITQTSLMGGQGTFALTSGKWYWEITLTSSPGTATSYIGVQRFDNAGNGLPDPLNGLYAYSWRNDAVLWAEGVSNGSYGTSWNTNDVINVAFDASAGAIWFGKNGVWQNNGNPAIGLNPSFDGLIVDSYFPIWGGGTTNAANMTLNFGQKNFTYTVPADFKAPSIENAENSDIPVSSNFFKSVVYTGNGSSQLINIGMQPDLVWTKRLDNTGSHRLSDSTRGSTNFLDSAVTSIESADAQGITSFASTGFNLGNSTNYNTNTAIYAAMCWKKSSLSGFDIVSFSGNNGSDRSLNHSLGKTPETIIVKSSTGGTSNWFLWHKNLTGNDYYLQLNSSAAENNTTSPWGTGTKDSNTFMVSAANNINTSGRDYIAYLWASVPGFSSMGYYVGTGLTDGPYIWTGFKPSFILIKRINGSDQNYLLSAARNTFNPVDRSFRSDTTAADSLNTAIDFVSNGFKIRTTISGINSGVGTYIYMAFADSYFKFDRAR